jgi:predicted phage replisome organizer
MDWIKIMCNILDHRKIKMIRKGPEGNTLVLLWLLLLSEAGKCNRGGYLMVSDSLAYTADTLSMVLDIPLSTVQLGLKIFSELDMIDSDDGAIFIKNWRKYQSEDKLAARREKDRLRQQRHRHKEREKLRALPPPGQVSRDNHVSMSRYVTQENREDKSREEQTTTEKVGLLLSGTPLAKISSQELKGLENKHGAERLLQAADVAAETWRRNREDKHNPGGYLHSLCASLVVPEWYVPYEQRRAIAKEDLHRKKRAGNDKALLRAQEKAKDEAMDALWNSLSAEQHEEYRRKALTSFPGNIRPSMAVTTIMEKLLASKEASPAVMSELSTAAAQPLRLAGEGSLR